MDFNIPEELVRMQKMAKDFTEKELLPHEAAITSTGEVPLEPLEKMKELGFYGITIPEEYGGIGLGVLGYCMIIMELAKGPKAFTYEMKINNSIGSKAIVLAGTEDQKQTFLPKMATGEYISAFGLTEPDAGSDAAAIKTYAIKEGEHWVINGTKHFISNAPTANIFTILALTDREKMASGGVTAFIVPKGTSGFRVGQLQETIQGLPIVQAELVFDDCRIPSSHVLGKVGNGFQIAMESLDQGRLFSAAEAIGLSERLLSLSTKYSKERVQFGKPIASQQAIRFMLADMAMEIYAAKMMLYNGAWKVEQGEKIPKEAAMIKLFASETVWRAADKAVQIFGGVGLMRDMPIEKIYREARLFRIVEGTSEIQRLIISREVLKGN
jgi:acyl-CoA dehydrogenase